MSSKIIPIGTVILYINCNNLRFSIKCIYNTIFKKHWFNSYELDELNGFIQVHNTTSQTPPHKIITRSQMLTSPEIHQKPTNFQFCKDSPKTRDLVRKHVALNKKVVVHSNNKIIYKRELECTVSSYISQFVVILSTFGK